MLSWCFFNPLSLFPSFISLSLFILFLSSSIILYHFHSPIIASFLLRLWKVKWLAHNQWYKLPPKTPFFPLFFFFDQFSSLIINDTPSAPHDSLSCRVFLCFSLSLSTCVQLRYLCSFFCLFPLWLLILLSHIFIFHPPLHVSLSSWFSFTRRSRAYICQVHARVNSL